MGTLGRQIPEVLVQFQVWPANKYIVVEYVDTEEG